MFGPKSMCLLWDWKKEQLGGHIGCLRPLLVSALLDCIYPLKLLQSLILGKISGSYISVIRYKITVWNVEQNKREFKNNE